MARTSKKKETVEVIEPVEPVAKAPVLKPITYNKTDDICVKSGYPGKLIFRSDKTGLTYIWEDMSAENYISVDELLDARGKHPKFFSKNYFLFEDMAIVEYLKMSKYYVNALTSEEFATIFSLPDAQMVERIAQLSAGQRRTLSYLATAQVDSKDIDSRKKIEALEQALGEKFLLEE